VLPRSPVRVSI